MDRCLRSRTGGATSVPACALVRHYSGLVLAAPVRCTAVLIPMMAKGAPSRACRTLQLGCCLWRVWWLPRLQVADVNAGVQLLLMEAQEVRLHAVCAAWLVGSSGTN
jgi:hypothetical protein